jgi:5,10-methylenetetrahydromethanopterin reductase
VRIGVTGMARGDFDNYLDWVRYMDRTGFAYLGFGDSQCRWMECWTVLGATALNTERILLGPFITNPTSRHPAVAASAAVTLQKISGGRELFGIGLGETAIRDLGEHPMPLPQFEEYVKAVKGLCDGRTVEYQGRELCLLWEAAPVKVLVAGDGPRVQRLAGRVADGAIVGNGATPEVVRHALSNIRAGAEEAGRDPDNIEVWFMTRVNIADTEDEVYRELRPYMATYANTRYRSSAEAKGIRLDGDLAERVRGLRREFRYAESLMPTVGHNAELVDKYGLREWLGRQFVVAGPPDRCIERLKELEAAGAKNIVVPRFMGDVMGDTKTLGEQILPAFL